MGQRLWPLLISVVLIVSGCATLQSDFETPTVNVTSIRAIEKVLNALGSVEAARHRFAGACIMPPFDHYEVLRNGNSSPFLNDILTSDDGVNS